MGTANWTPQPGWLLVQPITSEESQGKIVLTQNVRDAWTHGQFEVILSGGPPLRPLDEDDQWLYDRKTFHDFQPGDWIVAGHRKAIEDATEDLWLLPCEAVYAVIR